jgi:hypothetical protein
MFMTSLHLPEIDGPGAEDSPGSRNIAHANLLLFAAAHVPHWL